MQRPFAILLSVLILIAATFIDTGASALPVETEICSVSMARLSQDYEAGGLRSEGWISLLEYCVSGAVCEPYLGGKIEFSALPGDQAGSPAGVKLIFHVPDTPVLRDRPGTELYSRMQANTSPNPEYFLVQPVTGLAGIDCETLESQLALRGNFGVEIFLTGLSEGSVCVGLTSGGNTIGEACSQVRQTLDSWAFHPFPGLPIGEHRSAAGIVEVDLKFEPPAVGNFSGDLRGKATVAIKSITLGPSG